MRPYSQTGKNPCSCLLKMSEALQGAKKRKTGILTQTTIGSKNSTQLASGQKACLPEGGDMPNNLYNMWINSTIITTLFLHGASGTERREVYQIITINEDVFYKALTGGSIPRT